VQVQGVQGRRREGQAQQRQGHHAEAHEGEEVVNAAAGGDVAGDVASRMASRVKEKELPVLRLLLLLLLLLLPSNRRKQVQEQPWRPPLT
jgi:hypothetical protein